MADEQLLRKKVIRLAHENPSLRLHLLPLLTASDEEEDTDKESIVMIQQHLKKKKKRAEEVEDKESRYDEGPLSPAEKKELFRENPEFAEEHAKNKDVIKRMMQKRKQK